MKVRQQKSSFNAINDLAWTRWATILSASIAAYGGESQRVIAEVGSKEKDLARRW